MNKSDYNQHLLTALSSVSVNTHPVDGQDITVTDQTVHFRLQCGPVREQGRNGCDATDIIKYLIGLYRSFNNTTPCRENSISITKLEEALHWQIARTTERSIREVEGTDEE